MRRSFSQSTVFGFCKKQAAGFLRECVARYKLMWFSFNLFVIGTERMIPRLKAVQRYTTILEVNRAAITEPGLDEIFQGTCGAVKNIVPYDRMGLSLCAPETESLKLVAATGCGPDSFYQTGLMLDCGQTHHGWVFQHKKAIVRGDLQKEIEFQMEQYSLKEVIRSYCAVPLVIP